MSILLRDVRKSFGSTLVLSLDRLEIPEGAQWVVTGKSGSGKTTFLNLIAGILLPDAGTVEVERTDLTALSESQRDLFRARRIGFVFQTFNLLPGFTALENVLLGMLFAGKTDRSKAEGLLERVGLADRMSYRPDQLSVGQQQRVAIARALANDPALILADEPTSALDADNRDRFLELLLTLAHRHSTSVLFVSHDQSLARHFDNQLELQGDRT